MLDLKTVDLNNLQIEMDNYQLPPTWWLWFVMILY